MDRCSPVDAVLRRKAENRLPLYCLLITAKIGVKTPVFSYGKTGDLTFLASYIDHETPDYCISQPTPCLDSGYAGLRLDRYISIL